MPMKSTKPILITEFSQDDQRNSVRQLTVMSSGDDLPVAIRYQLRLQAHFVSQTFRIIDAINTAGRC
jgi:hypothetical protein